MNFSFCFSLYHWDLSYEIIKLATQKLQTEKKYVFPSKGTYLYISCHRDVRKMFSLLVKLENKIAFYQPIELRSG